METGSSATSEPFQQTVWTLPTGLLHPRFCVSVADEQRGAAAVGAP